MRSLRPVLDSLFHRFLLCPAPQNRHDAIKVVKEVGKEGCEVIKTSVNLFFISDVSSPSKQTCFFKVVKKEDKEVCEVIKTSVRLSFQ